MIKLLRVDYRLVHGQVAISWSRHIGADCILVANDEVAKDEMRQSMLRLSKPQGMKLVIKSIAKEIPELNYVNLGVLPANENTKALSKAINVTSEDVKTLKKLLAKNIEIDIQQVPTEAITHVDEKLLES